MEQADAKYLIDKLANEHVLSLSSYEKLIASYTPQLAEYAAQIARSICISIYGTSIYTRGLIEFSNYCKNNCFYCGIRAQNRTCSRYRLSNEQILACANEGYQLGFRTFVLQSGEDDYYTDDILSSLIRKLKEQHPDCAITLSLGERSKESYCHLREAGADRYLLRHETADPKHYAQLHPTAMSFDNRIQCLYDLRELGFTVGAGFIVGSPYQTPKTLAADLKFIEQFKPEMCGIGPFVPHHATAFAAYEHGSVELTCFLLSLLRLIQPNLLLPATTALATLANDGRERAILAGANVVMPNLSPRDVRAKYELYDNKACVGEEAAECRMCLENRMKRIGRQLVVDRGDPKVLS